LKYEKFEPPSLASLSPSSSLDKSPEMENLPQLNMDLMPEMHDVIYQKTAAGPAANISQPPRVNRQVSQK
jgi:hypothetical protein